MWTDRNSTLEMHALLSNVPILITFDLYLINTLKNKTCMQKEKIENDKEVDYSS